RICSSARAISKRCGSCAAPWSTWIPSKPPSRCSGGCGARVPTLSSCARSMRTPPRGREPGPARRRDRRVERRPDGQVRLQRLDGKKAGMTEFEGVSALLDEYARVEAELADPEVHSDAAKSRALGRRYA